MANIYHFLMFCVFIFIKESASQLSEDRDELLNWCLESQNHKSKPGKEDHLHSQCSPWKDHACCSEGVTTAIHELNMYNFTFDHCFSEAKTNMSSQCRKHFIQDSCFYECEPHIGLWVVQINRKIAKERFFNVPLCASDCDSWFDACKYDYTCAYNWPRDFKFSKGHNTCKEEAKCMTFFQMYRTAKEFCENVWDHSWVYTPDDKPCMQMWFDESEGNPNREVAEHYISERFGTGAASSLFYDIRLFLLGTIFVWVWNRNSNDVNVHNTF